MTTANKLFEGVIKMQEIATQDKEGELTRLRFPLIPAVDISDIDIQGPLGIAIEPDCGKTFGSRPCIKAMCGGDALYRSEKRAPYRGCAGGVETVQIGSVTYVKRIKCKGRCGDLTDDQVKERIAAHRLSHRKRFDLHLGKVKIAKQPEEVAAGGVHG